MNICMLAYTFYEYDNRVMRCAEALVKRGDHVDVISLKKEGQSNYTVYKGVNIYRIQKRRPEERTGKVFYLIRINRFLIRSFCILMLKNIKKRYDFVHVHSPPDYEIFAAWITKITGAKLILDIHDIVPEFYLSKFKVPNDLFVYKFLVLIEKISIKFAHHVIVSNHMWQKKLLSRSVNRDKCTVILNYPDPTIFYPRPVTKNHNKFLMIYPGTISYHQGLDIAIEAVSLVKDRLTDAELHIYGAGTEKITLKRLIKEKRLENCVFINGLLPLDEIAQVMANSDLGIVPKRSDSFGNEAFSTKILEFMALGVPVLVSDTEIDRFYFSENLVKFFKSGDVHDMAENILLLYQNKGLRKYLSKTSLEYVEQNNWEVKKAEYLQLIT